MIIVKFLGGLGNQIFQYAHGKKLAKERNTLLASDIHTYSVFREREYTLDKFQTKLLPLPKKAINFFCKPYLHKVDQYSPIKLFHHYVEEPSNQWLHIPHEKNLYVRGYWTCNVYFDDIVDEIKQDLELKPKYTNEAFLKYKNIVTGSLSIGIHIRRGDYASNETYNKYFGTTPVSYYNAAVEVLKAKLHNPEFYIFSDDPEWVKLNMPFLKDAVYVGDGVEGKDYLEFDLLKSCKHQIISNSTFSWWASRLNSNPDKIIIQPSQWYRDEAAQKIYEEKKAFYQPQAIII